jgi:GDP-L-fucose synthase
MQSHINVGFGRDISIAELAQAVALCVGYAGQIVFDATKPDGVAREWIDSGRLNSLGWKPKVQLEDGLKLAYLHFSRSSHSSAN